MSHDLTWPHNQRVMLHGWVSVIICHYPAKFCGRRPCRRGIIVFLIGHVTSLDRVGNGFWVIPRQWGTAMSPILSDFDKFCSNVSTYEKQKWAKFFHLTLNGFWDISFWNLGNFKAFFQKSAILNFPYLMKLS